MIEATSTDNSGNQPSGLMDVTSVAGSASPCATVEIDGAVFGTAARQAERLWEPLTPEEHQAIMQDRLRLHDPGDYFTTRVLRSKPGGDEPGDTAAQAATQ